jgi:hypothetical protein
LNSRLCRRLAVFSVATGAVFMIVNVVLWLVPAWTPLVARGMADLQVEPITITPMVRWIGLACSSLYLGVLMRGLWIARLLFDRLAVGLVFEPETGLLLRRFGVALVVYAALAPFVSALMSWLVTMHNGPHERLLRFGLAEHEIVLAIVGALIPTTESVMTEAARMAEEHRQIV